MTFTVVSLNGNSHTIEAEHYSVDSSGTLWFYGPPDESNPSYAPPVVRVFSARYWSQFRPEGGV